MIYMVGMGFNLFVKHGKREETVSLPDSDPYVKQLENALQEKYGLSPQTMKLMGKGLKGMLALAQVPHDYTAESIGLKSGAKVLLLGSHASELQAIEQAKDKSCGLRMPSFDREVLMAAARRRTARPVEPPKGTPYTFHDYQTLPARRNMFPAPAEALKLLHRLASDPGVMKIMADNQFSVGSLREMPPEGLVGISETCILGYNVKRGQEIYLRLRTDDGKGFRKYRTIIKTLVHELTHNVHDPHDNNFKALCSKLNNDVDAVNTRLSQGGKLAVHGLHRGCVPDREDEEVLPEEHTHPAMMATQASSGKTLRQLASEAHNATAASSQLPQQQAQPQQAQSIPAAPGGSLNDGLGVEKQGKEKDLCDVAFVYEHRNEETEELERQQQQLEQ